MLSGQFTVMHRVDKALAFNLTNSTSPSAFCAHTLKKKEAPSQHSLDC
jgi:hypothetical protein